MYSSLLASDHWLSRCWLLWCGWRKTIRIHSFALAFESNAKVIVGARSMMNIEPFDCWQTFVLAHAIVDWFLQCVCAWCMPFWLACRLHHLFTKFTAAFYNVSKKRRVNEKHRKTCHTRKAWSCCCCCCRCLMSSAKCYCHRHYCSQLVQLANFRKRCFFFFTCQPFIVPILLQIQTTFISIFSNIIILLWFSLFGASINTFFLICTCGDKRPPFT